MRWKISGWQGDETRGENMAGVIGSNIIVWDVEKNSSCYCFFCYASGRQVTTYHVF